MTAIEGSMAVLTAGDVDGAPGSAVPLLAELAPREHTARTSHTYGSRDAGSRGGASRTSETTRRANEHASRTNDRGSRTMDEGGLTNDRVGRAPTPSTTKSHEEKEQWLP
ncbi:hypothetical protein ACIBHX_37685 [Nonomuraea sp. NPDC050536]|uniref:hypothetical protein n=1 Tax=Nonomuraea sp. NPDC050536 TaxID=3364366 RepID=UPI0037CC48C9